MGIAPGGGRPYPMLAPDAARVNQPGAPRNPEARSQDANQPVRSSPEARRRRNSQVSTPLIREKMNTIKKAPTVSRNLTRTIHRKDNVFLPNQQEIFELIPPCCSCDRWNACGGIGYAWVSCAPFREYMRTSRRAAAEKAWREQSTSKTTMR